MRVLGLYLVHQLAQRGGTTDTGHVLQRYLVGAELHQLVHNAHVVFHSVHRRVGDAQGGLAYHAGLLGVLHTELEVARVVQAAERAHDVNTLGFLHLGHQTAHVGRHTIHAQTVQRTLQHVGLYAGLVESFGPCTHGLVGVLTVHQVHLLKGTAVGLYAVKTPHVDNNRGNTLKLVYTRLVFSAALPHITVHQTEFYLFCHNATHL